MRTFDTTLGCTYSSNSNNPGLLVLLSGMCRLERRGKELVSVAGQGLAQGQELVPVVEQSRAVASSIYSAMAWYFSYRSCTLISFCLPSYSSSHSFAMSLCSNARNIHTHYSFFHPSCSSPHFSYPSLFWIFAYFCLCSPCTRLFLSLHLFLCSSAEFNEIVLQMVRGSKRWLISKDSI